MRVKGSALLTFEIVQPDGQFVRARGAIHRHAQGGPPWLVWKLQERSVCVMDHFHKFLRLDYMAYGL
jgi:hypothetical protein